MASFRQGSAEAKIESSWGTLKCNPTRGGPLKALGGQKRLKHSVFGHREGSSWGGSEAEFEMQPDATQPDSGRAFGHSQSENILKNEYKMGSQRHPERVAELLGHFEMQPDARAYKGALKMGKTP